MRAGDAWRESRVDRLFLRTCEACVTRGLAVDKRVFWRRVLIVLPVAWAPSPVQDCAPRGWRLRSPAESKNYFGLGSLRLGDGRLRRLYNFGAVRTENYTCELDCACENLEWVD